MTEQIENIRACRTKQLLHIYIYDICIELVNLIPGAKKCEYLMQKPQTPSTVALTRNGSNASGLARPALGLHQGHGPSAEPPHPSKEQTSIVWGWKRTGLKNKIPASVIYVSMFSWNSCPYDGVKTQTLYHLYRL